jgi:hypothetical protein
MSFTEDLSAFLDVTSGFAINATVLGQPVAGIFDNGHQNALGGFIESTTPSFMCSSSDIAEYVTGSIAVPNFTALAQGSALIINDVGYAVTEVHPDGTGMTTLLLEQT